jgi:imidazolonepropionase-like amidohydrolase
VGENAPVGVIETGARADLLIVDGDPRTDLEIVRRPAGVVVGGKPVDLAWVEQTLDELSLVLAEPLV